MLTDLLREHEELTQTINAHRPLISQRRRLPHEILQEIFIRCLPANKDPIISIYKIHLTQICKEGPLRGRCRDYGRQVLIERPSSRGVSNSLSGIFMEIGDCPILLFEIRQEAEEYCEHLIDAILPFSA